ncbi:MAG TPA: hypothetical protein VJZ71_05945 [Phycisphaerae bacterium]|nr:hypothetical protein [Phycisphaerae bacterium]
MLNRITYIQRAPVALLAACGLLFAFARPTSAQSTDAIDKSEVEARKAERERRYKEIADAQTRQEVEDFSASIKETCELLARLETKSTALRDRLQALLTDDDGKRLAQDDISYHAYLDLRDQPIASIREIQSRRKNMDSILDGLQAELKRLNVGWVPSPRLRQEMDENSTWAKSRLDQLERQESRLAAILFRAPKELDPVKAVTLEQKIRQEEAHQVESWAQALIRGEAAAKSESEKTIFDAARAAGLERGNEEANQIREARRAELAALRAEFEAEIKRRDAESQRLLAEANRIHADEIAQLRRELKIASAKRQAEDVRAEIEKQDVLNAADHEKKKQRCHAAEVKQLLAPFLAEGYTQPGSVEQQYNKLPISYSKLVSSGALNPDRHGLCQLLGVVTWKGDKVRPRWKMSGRNFEQLSPEEIERTKKVQQLLIELGPTLVEEKLLSP